MLLQLVKNCLQNCFAFLQIYKVTDEDMNCGNLVNAVISKIASKEFVTI